MPATPCASTYWPTPFPQAHIHTISQPSPPSTEMLTQLSRPKHSGPHLGSKSCPACCPPNAPRHRNQCYYALLYAAVQSYIPSSTTAEKQNEGSGAFSCSVWGCWACSGWWPVWSITYLSKCCNTLVTLISLVKQPNSSGDFATALQGSTATVRALTARPVITRRKQLVFFFLLFLFLFFFFNLHLLWTR